MTKRGNVRVRIDADPTGVKKGTKQAEQSLDHFAKRGVSHFGKLAASAAAAATAYMGIAEAKQAVDTTEDLAKATLGLNRALGLSVEESSRWAALARARNIDIKSLQQSFGVLSKNQQAAAQGYASLDAETTKLTASQADQARRQELIAKGAGQQADAFTKLGITQRDLKNLGFEDLLAKVADGMGRLPGGAERATIGMKLFGRGWQSVVPIMNDGAEGMRKQLELADKYGVTLKGKTVSSVKELIAAQREQQFATMGLQVAIGQHLVPVLTKVITAGNEFVQGMQDGTGAGGEFAKTIAGVADNLEPTVKWLGHAAEDVAGFASHHPEVATLAGKFLLLGTAIRGIKLASAITGFSTLLKAAKTTAVAIPPMYRKAGAEAGAEVAAGARSGGVLARMRASGAAMGVAWRTAFLSAATIGLAVALEQLINADPAGWDPGTEKKHLRQLRRSGQAGVAPADLLGLPRLSTKPQKGKRRYGIGPAFTPSKPWTAPTGGQGELIGTPGTGTHTLGNWQSDNAVDIRVTRGTPILAVEGGKVAKVVERSDGGGRFAGSQVTINGDSGNSYFYAHLSAVSVKAGQRVRAGEVIGASGVANGVPHLHFATEKGDPRTLKLPTGGFAVTRLTREQRTIYAAAKKYGIDPAILWGLYGQESSYGENLGPSSAGALGGFGLMPGTARELGVDPMNFRQAAYGAARYLARFKGRGTRGMLAAYNAGPNGNPNNKETRAYIPGVLDKAKTWGTVDDGDLDINPTDWRKVAEQIATITMRPVIKRLRRQLKPLASSMARSDRSIGRFDDRVEILDARIGSLDRDTEGGDLYDALAAKRKAIFGRAFERGRKQRALQAAADRYAAAIKRLKAKLGDAPKAQRPTIRKQIRRYQQRLKALRDEARQIGVQLKIDAADMKDVRDEIADLSATEAPDFIGGVQKHLDAAALAASFTLDKNDDVAAATKAFSFYQRNYDASVKRGDVDGQIEWGGKLQSAKEQLAALTGGGSDDTEKSLQAEILKATLTKNTAGSKAATEKLRAYYQSKYDEAIKNGDVDAQLEWGSKLQSAIDALTSALEDNTAALQAQNDLLRQQADEANRRAAIAENESGQLGRWLVDWLSGELGGRIGPGFQTPAAAGVVAQY